MWVDRAPAPFPLPERVVACDAVGMPDGGAHGTEETLRALTEVVAAPADALPERLSALLAAFVPHEALVALAADADGERRLGAGDIGFVEAVSSLQLGELRRTVAPGAARRSPLAVGEAEVPTLQVIAPNGALLVMARPRGDGQATATVVHLWTIVADRVQQLADAAGPEYLQRARHTAGERAEVLVELADEYSAAMESVLGALRFGGLGDRAARLEATRLAEEGLLQVRADSDRARSHAEEPVASAFERLRTELRPLLRYHDVRVQFVEPPVDGRPLPSEVARGARAVVRGSIISFVDQGEIGRIRVQWDCDGTNLLVELRDDGPGEMSETATQLQLVRQRVRALGGRITVAATPGWGTELSIAIPLDPPHATAAAVALWDLRPRERQVLELLISGCRNRTIAAELGISENTVKFHVARIYRKLSVSSRAEAAAVVLEQAPPRAAYQ